MLALRALSFVLLLRIAQDGGASAAPLASSLHAVAVDRRAADAGQPRQLEVFRPRYDLQGKQRRCADVEDIPVIGLNLTHDERALLPHLCWQPHRVPRRPQKLPQGARQQDLPPGVHCEAVQWCEKDGGACATVCKRGSVKVEPWLKNAINTQTALTNKLPFCYANLLGSHNSGITLADGYGTLDPYFQKYFEWIKFASSADRLQTNDHVLSLTDQLNLGVRLIELDTHWVQGNFVIAHCGGFHSFFNTLIKAVNLVAKLLGHHIRWDTETIGCDPSLSSIPTGEQRTLDSALEEIADWMATPGNEREFVTLFFDDQSDLGDWGLIPLLMQRVTAFFPEPTIYGPPQQDARAGGGWPSIGELLDGGKRLLLLSGIDYGPVMHPLIFLKADPVCNFFEPNLTTYIGAPTCIADAYKPDERRGVINGGRTMAGQMYRMTTCEITYGPLNCDFIFKADNEPLLDEASLPDVASCGVNVPSPDMLTPQRSASWIWTWAPAHPYAPFEERSMRRLMAEGRTARWALAAAADAAERAWARLRRPHNQDLGCAIVSATDGRWRAVSCSGGQPRATACRAADADATRPPPPDKLWTVGVGDRGACPWGFDFRLPATSKENLWLRAALAAQKLDSAWLPVTGPSWKVA